MKRFITAILILALIFGNVSVSGNVHVASASTLSNYSYTFNTIDGGTVSTTTEDGKMTIIVFGKTTCPNSQRVVENITNYVIPKSEDTRVIFAECNYATLEETQEFAETYGCENITFCYDEGSTINSAMWRYVSSTSSVILPVVAFIDENNNIKNVTTGYITVGEIWEEIEYVEEEETSGGSEAGSDYVDDGYCKEYKGSNIEAQEYIYSRWSSTVKSYLTECEDGTLMRVQYDSENEGVLAEYYDSDYNVVDAKIIPEELPTFGGFYSTDSNYFIISGQNNSDESDDVEVFRITKYDKQWNRIGSAGLYGANTTVPFDAGSCRMEVCGKYLIVRTCHKMYTSSDGLNHQANVTVALDIDTMTITASSTRVSNSSTGYVSHSFNQFLLVDNNRLVTIDHGDAYPRSIVLIKFSSDLSKGGYGGASNIIDVMEFPGSIGANDTGASIGGFEMSGSNYLVAGNSVVQDEDNLSRTTRNIFIAAVDKSTSEVTTNWITSYEEGEDTVSNPQFVKISDDRFIVLWSRNGEVNYTEIDSDGEQVGEIYTIEGNLSDCQLIVKDGQVIWYTWKNNDIKFYSIDVNDLRDIEVTERQIGHDYKNLGVSSGVANLECTKCGYTTQISVITNMSIWWNDRDGTGMYSSYCNKYKTAGDALYCWTDYSGTYDNEEMEYILSDESIATVETVRSDRVKITFKKTGEVDFTVRPKYNPDYSETVHFYVSGPLELYSLTTDKENATYGDTIVLTADAAGGQGTLKYRFYEIDENGNQTVLKDYTTSSTYQWKPAKAGTRTLYVDVKDEAGEILTESVEDFVVTKADAPETADIEKKYCYAVGGSNQIINVASMLPADMGECTYNLVSSDPYGILGNATVSKAGVISYNVNDSGEIGDYANLTVEVESQNYDTSYVKVNISLIDKLPVEPKTGYEPEVSGSNKITYGDKISNLELNAGKAKFADADGNVVSGTLNWAEPDKVPEAGTTNAEWIFVPDSAEYQSCTGSVEIIVNKLTPTVATPTAETVTYYSKIILDYVGIYGELGSAIIGGREAQVNGYWSWKEPEQKINAGTYKYVAVFTPYDVNNYNSAEKEVSVTVEKATPAISTPYASDITYGDSLKESVLTDGQAIASGYIVDGTFMWEDDSIMPEVSDSIVTEYNIVFIPNDSANYNTVYSTVPLVINPAENAPNMPGTFMNVANSITKVSDIELPEGWNWDENDANTELAVGEETYAVAYYKDQDNYKNCSAIIAIVRSECQHEESDMITDVSATCSKVGYGHVICTICEEVLRDNLEIPMIAHNYTNWKETNVGTHMGTCDACEATMEQEHTWDSGKVTKPATTAAEGIKTYTCTVCGATKTQDIAKLEEPSTTAKPTTTAKPQPTTTYKNYYTPAKVKLKKLKNVKTKKVKVTWKQTTGGILSVDGWQLQYATNKKFTKNKKTKTIKWYNTSTTVKKLKKGKKYYFRIRAYTKDTYGTKHYGKWSSVKKVKVKK